MGAVAPDGCPLTGLVAFQGAADDEGVYLEPEKTASRAQVAATDGTRIFSAFDGVEQPEQGRNETAAQRVARIADMVGWPSTLRGISPLAGGDLARSYDPFADGMDDAATGRRHRPRPTLD